MEVTQLTNQHSVMMGCEQHKPIQYSHKIFLVQYVTVLIAVSLMKKKD